MRTSIYFFFLSLITADGRTAGGGLPISLTHSNGTSKKKLNAVRVRRAGVSERGGGDEKSTEGVGAAMEWCGWQIPGRCNWSPSLLLALSPLSLSLPLPPRLRAQAAPVAPRPRARREANL